MRKIVTEFDAEKNGLRMTARGMSAEGGCACVLIGAFGTAWAGMLLLIFGSIWWGILRGDGTVEDLLGLVVVLVFSLIFAAPPVLIFGMILYEFFGTEKAELGADGFRAWRGLWGWKFKEKFVPLEDITGFRLEQKQKGENGSLWLRAGSRSAGFMEMPGVSVTAVRRLVEECNGMLEKLRGVAVAEMPAAPEMLPQSVTPEEMAEVFTEFTVEDRRMRWKQVLRKCGKDHWDTIKFMTVSTLIWCGISTFGFVMALRGGGEPPVMIFLSLFMLVGALFFCLWLASIFGEETLELDDGGLRLVWRVLFYVRDRRYPLESVRGFWLETKKGEDGYSHALKVYAGGKERWLLAMQAVKPSHKYAVEIAVAEAGNAVLERLKGVPVPEECQARVWKRELRDALDEEAAKPAKHTRNAPPPAPEILDTEVTQVENARPVKNRSLRPADSAWHVVSDYDSSVFWRKERFSPLKTVWWLACGMMWGWLCVALCLHITESPELSGWGWAAAVVITVILFLLAVHEISHFLREALKPWRRICYRVSRHEVRTGEVLFGRWRRRKTHSLDGVADVAVEHRLAEDEDFYALVFENAAGKSLAEITDLTVDEARWMRDEILRNF